MPQSNAPSVLSRNNATVNRRAAQVQRATLLAAGGLEGVSGSRHAFSSRRSATSKVCPRSPSGELTGAQTLQLMGAQSDKTLVRACNTHTAVLLDLSLAPGTLSRLPAPHVTSKTSFARGAGGGAGEARVWAARGGVGRRLRR